MGQQLDQVPLWLQLPIGTIYRFAAQKKKENTPNDTKGDTFKAVSSKAREDSFKRDTLPLYKQKELGLI